MNTAEQPLTRIEGLQEELAAAKADRDAAALKLANDTIYRGLVLKQWAYCIRQIEARIERERMPAAV